MCINWVNEIYDFSQLPAPPSPSLLCRCAPRQAELSVPELIARTARTGGISEPRRDESGGGPNACWCLSLSTAFHHFQQCHG